MKILVSGRIQTGSYVNQEGNKVYTINVIVEEHYFAEGKNPEEKDSLPLPVLLTEPVQNWNVRIMEK